MEVETHDWTGMALVDVVLVKTRLRSRTVITICLVNISFFSTDPKCSSFVVREVKGRDGHFTGLVVPRVDELQCFLGCVSALLRDKGEIKERTCG